MLLEPNRVRVVRQEVALKRWPERLNGFTIALLTDFHYDPVFSVHPIRAAVDIVNGLGPDLVALTGDFVTDPLFGPSAAGAKNADPCAEILRNIKARHGLWAVMGNHDTTTNPKRVTAALRNVGVQVLLNQSTPIERDGTRFWLSGIGDAAERKSDLAATLRPVPSEESVVLLAHEPDFADYASRHPIDLQLSGHSHGGQIRLPFVPPLYLPALGKKYIWGRYAIGKLTWRSDVTLVMLAGCVNERIKIGPPPESGIFRGENRWLCVNIHKTCQAAQFSGWAVCVSSALS